MINAPVAVPSQFAGIVMEGKVKEFKSGGRVSGAGAALIPILVAAKSANVAFTRFSEMT